MEVYSITHAVDIDGMSSAAFLVRYHGLPLGNIIFSNYSYRRFERTEKEIIRRHPTNALLIFSDLNVNAWMLPRLVRLFTRLKKSGNRIVWLDHHPWSDGAVEKLSRFCELIVEGENRERCGAELVYRMLCDHDGFGDRLAEFAHTADFALPYKTKLQGSRIMRFAQVITYFNLGDMEKGDRGLRRIVACLANGDYDNAYIRVVQARYKKIMNERIASLLKSTTVVEANGIRMAIGFSSKISGSIGCRAMMEKFRSRITLYVDYNPAELSGNIRSTGGIDCSIMARAMGGGGHPAASGFSIPKGLYDFSGKSGREKFISRIRSIASKAY